MEEVLLGVKCIIIPLHATEKSFREGNLVTVADFIVVLFLRNCHSHPNLISQCFLYCSSLELTLQYLQGMTVSTSFLTGHFAAQGKTPFPSLLCKQVWPCDQNFGHYDQSRSNISNASHFKGGALLYPCCFSANCWVGMSKWQRTTFDHTDEGNTLGTTEPQNRRGHSFSARVLTLRSYVRNK